MNNIDLFVPGRLCLFGEHSDWAIKYSDKNKKIKKGLAAIVCIDKGIHASICSDVDKFTLTDNKKKFTISINENDLLAEINSNSYYSYVCSTILYMVKNYGVGGIKIDVLKNDLPEKKGLSSSASICVLICRAFNKIYNLNLTISDEMKIAYESERFIGIKCGQMDQVVAIGSGAHLMTFRKNSYDVNRLDLKKDLYFVYADLNGCKDTKKILDSLNSAFPIAKNKVEEDVLKYFEDVNYDLVTKATKYIVEGNALEIGKLMTIAQEKFDKLVAPICMEELESPKLHGVLNDSYIKSISLGGKGVGSQGDGAVQFIVEDLEKQELLTNYLISKLGLEAYSFTIPKSNSVYKAVIPIAGAGTRMMPYTNAVPKALIPIIRDGKFKPVILVLVEELLEAGIKNIILVIDRKDEDIFNKVFDKKYKDKITYAYQDLKNGLGGALLCCEPYIDKERFLLVLGDQFYKSNSNISCTKQLLDVYSNLGNIMISVCSVLKKDISSYGIYFGNNSKDSIFKVNKILEKPSIKEAMKYNNTGKYYAAFGEYILDYKILEELKKIKDKNNSKDIPFTELLDTVYENEIFAFIPNGLMYDLGNIEAYKKSMIDYYKEN